MKLKTKRRIALATLIAACLLVPFLTPAEPEPTLTFNEAWDMCDAMFPDDWGSHVMCMDVHCPCIDDPEPTG